jgi:hypothetical protein
LAGLVTREGLLGSRFATADILRALPAQRVLESENQGSLVAGLIAQACGGDPDRWTALQGGSNRHRGRRSSSTRS